MKANPKLMLQVVAIASLLAVPRQTPAAEEIQILVYNTHGLPSWIAGDNPQQRFPVIGQKSQSYDLTLLQEDFNHHEKLREGTGAATLLRGPTSRMPCCAFCSGSGLTAISRLPQSWQLTATNHAYQTCAGWIIGANDCLATKGVQLLRLTTPAGATLFIANTHMDAGSRAADREARRAQLETLREVIATEVGAHALLVVGDLNLDDSEPLDRALLDSVREDLGLVDSGAHPQPQRGWEILDYILYRSGIAARIEILQAGEVESMTIAGAPLSDHPALFVRLRISS